MIVAISKKRSIVLLILRLFPSCVIFGLPHNTPDYRNNGCVEDNMRHYYDQYVEVRS